MESFRSFLGIVRHFSTSNIVMRGTVRSHHTDVMLNGKIFAQTSMVSQYGPILLLAPRRAAASTGYKSRLENLYLQEGCGSQRLLPKTLPAYVNH